MINPRNVWARVHVASEFLSESLCQTLLVIVSWQCGTYTAQCHFHILSFTLLSINYCFASDKGDSLPNEKPHTAIQEKMNVPDNNGGFCWKKRKV